MKHDRIYWPDLRVTVMSGSFAPEAGTSEYHVIIIPDASIPNPKEQHLAIDQAVRRLENLPEMRGTALVWKRLFVGDAPAQAALIEADGQEALSVVGQPPLGGSEVAAWLYFAEGARVIKDADGASIMKRPAHTHVFHTGLHERDMEGVGDQTNSIFESYGRSLARRACTLASNCIRTWIFVNDVDSRYADMVTARREHFEREGLTPQTHYIASTGIEGSSIHPEAKVMMDAYAISGIDPAQIRYLQALTHLNPTYEYGVTFERATEVTYGDRRHIFISGTASIDNSGEIVHPGDVEKQTARAFENVEALLAEADAVPEDVASMIVYLRNAADYEIVNGYIEQHYPDIPRVTVLAPVCRPGWLVEVECIAIKPTDNDFAPY